MTASITRNKTSDWNAVVFATKIAVTKPKFGVITNI